jgi:hypothetical protein
MTDSAANTPATQGQESFLRNLLLYRVVPDALTEKVLAAFYRGVTRADAETLIPQLRALPDKISDEDHAIALRDVHNIERSLADAVWDQNR